MSQTPRIYTRAGDSGRTRLGNGALVPKTDPRVEACGAVDELNAVIGLALAAGLPDEPPHDLAQVQGDLFAVGADLSSPAEAAGGGPPRRVTAALVARLERQIDVVGGQLPPLRRFVLPGGRGAGGWLHLARTVCRRAERRVWALGAADNADRFVAVYLNRLSDLLFVLARAANRAGPGEAAWEPEGPPDEA